MLSRKIVISRDYGSGSDHLGYEKCNSICNGPFKYPSTYIFEFVRGQFLDFQTLVLLGHNASPSINMKHPNM